MRMQRSPTGCKPACPGDGEAVELSRRGMIAGASVAPMLAGIAQPAALSDTQTNLCHRWLAIDAERGRLQLEWGRLEGWLMKKRNWYQLTPEQQAGIPEGARLAEIDARLDVLWDEAGELLETIRPAKATSIEAVAAKLAVVASLVLVDDHPEAHDMITRAVKDLSALSNRR